MIKSFFLWTFSTIAVCFILTDVITSYSPVSWHGRIGNEDIRVTINGYQFNAIITSLSVNQNGVLNTPPVSYDVVSPIGAFFVEKYTHMNKYTSYVGAFGISLRMMAMIFLAWPLSVVTIDMYRGSVRNKRLKNNLCVRCSYNLTGNVSGVCTECGLALA